MGHGLADEVGRYPAEQPTKFALVVYITTAIASTVPETVLARADEVIEMSGRGTSEMGYLLRRFWTSELPFVRCWPSNAAGLFAAACNQVPIPHPTTLAAPRTPLALCDQVQQVRQWNVWPESVDQRFFPVLALPVAQLADQPHHWLGIFSEGGGAGLGHR